MCGCVERGRKTNGEGGSEKERGLGLGQRKVCLFMVIKWLITVKAEVGGKYAGI